MSYLTSAQHAALIADPSLIETYYVNGWRQFASDLGTLDTNLNLDASLLPVAYATIAAWDLKRYGTEPSDVSLLSLLAAPTLACDDYVRLAWNLATLMPQTKWAPANLAAVGWNNGVVGNHAQLLAWDASATLLCDPTIGLIARTSFNDLSQGKPIPPMNIASFERYNQDGLDAFRATVRQALLTGTYRPSNLLYYVKSLAQYNAMPPSNHWLTPGI